MKRLLAWCGRLLLRLFPAEFRGRYGDDIIDFFKVRSREVGERRGLVGVASFWLRGVWDVVRTAVAERGEERAMRRAHVEGRAGTWRFDIGRDLRFAFRSLRRTPGFTLVALLTLALGIGSTTAMFSVLDTALRRALPFPDPDQLVLGRATFTGYLNPWVSFPDYMDYRDQARSLESLSAIGGWASPVTLSGAGEPQQARLTYITADLFETLGVSPVLGSTFSIEELPRGGAGEVVISHDLWQQWFGGSPDVVGRSLVVDGGPLTVAGVMPAGFRFMYDTDLWVPPWPGNSDPANRRFHNWLLVGRMASGVSLDAARADVDVISTRLQAAYPDSNRDKALQLDDLHGAMAEGYRQSLLVLTGAIVLVLLIACGNVAILLMARDSTRTSEVAVRAALGAGRLRLARQLLVECVVLALAGGGMGVVAAVSLQNLILRFVSMDLLGIHEAGPSPTMMMIAAAVSLGTVLVFGVLPSLSAARTDPAVDLKEGGTRASSRSGSRYRSGLIVLQVALSLVLLMGSGLLLRSYANLRGVDPGFRVDDLLTATISLPSDRYADAQRRSQFFTELKEGVEALPGVQSVGLVSQLPILQPAGNYAIWNPTRPPEGDNRPPWADWRVILPGYFETMDIPVLEGRPIEGTDVEGSAPVIVLSETTANTLFPDESPLGRQVAVDLGGTEPRSFEVVGVVGDHQTSSLSGAVRPVMFTSYAQRPLSTMRLAVATAGDPMNLVKPVQARLSELDREVLLGDVQTMQVAIDASISDAREVTTVMSLFAGVAITLAALGLYGVLAFFVTRSMHEIGIRVALGARSGAVLRLVVTRGLRLVAGGVVVGAVGSIGATRVVRSMLFQTSATDPLTFAFVTGFFVIVALVACVLPASKALRVDPVEAFRAE